MAKLKRLTKQSVGKDMEKPELSFMADGIVKSHKNFGNSVLYKVKHTLVV